MKTRNKIMLLALCMVALIAVSVLGTMAYLTSTKTVTNTFTVGKVEITLDEARVNTAGEKLYVPSSMTEDEKFDAKNYTTTEEGNTIAKRVAANNYKLMPGHTYTKDPTIHVAGGSENSWIFIKVENGISAFEAEGNNKIATQIASNHWTALTGADGVYYCDYTSQSDAKDIAIFDTIVIADNAETKTEWNASGDKIVAITAYAIQKDGFEDVATAWNTVSKQNTTTDTAEAGN